MVKKYSPWRIERHLGNGVGGQRVTSLLASYNRGEAGVRRVLHQIAQEKGGFRKEKRDFWHLYRLKRLPAETMDYVPRVLAAAVVCGDPQRYGLAPPPAPPPNAPR